MKDMKKVNDFERNRQLDMMRFSCFNNASALLAGSLGGNLQTIISASQVVQYAEKLFDAILERDYLNYNKIKDNRSIDKMTGKIAEPPSSAVGGVPVTLTEKEGREMDVDFPESKEDYEENNEVVI